MRKILAFAIGMVTGTVAFAEGGLVFSPAATEACLAAMTDSQDPTTCIGSSANHCMETTEGGWSTYGMSQCLDQERDYWDQRLNAAYKAVRATRKATDKDMADLGSAAPSQGDALKNMQRAWIAYRDATCDYERSLWGGGTGGGPATVSCLMYMTAEQALYLEADGLVE